MARNPAKELLFEIGCGDCGTRRVDLPPALPEIEDDFDWLARDYDSFRRFMMEELAHRFPERRRWTAADIEVVIVELLAAALDRLSHALDVIHAEHFLETAGRPQSVRRLLQLIGYDAYRRTDPSSLDRLPPLPGDAVETDAEKLERLWRLYPHDMEKARTEGPRHIGEQVRMVSLADHASRLESHPLVERARARLVWTGAWNTILISLLLDDARQLDDLLHEGDPPPEDGKPSKLSANLWAAIEAYHNVEGLPRPPITDALTARQLLRIIVERFRMIGSEVFLENAIQVPITFWISVKAKDGYFRSEIRDSLADVLSSDRGGLFEPGNLGFGDHVFASNIIEAAMTVEGVETACLNRFKRMGNDYADRTDFGRIEIAIDEIAICQQQSGAPELGRFDITVLGGETG